MTRRSILLCALMLLGLMHSACTSRFSSTEEVSPPVIVTGQADGAPPGGGPEDVASRLAAWTEAINRGDLTKVRLFFSEQPFQQDADICGIDSLPRSFVATGLATITGS